MEVTCKLGSKGCWNDGKCRATSNCENKVVTNADRIRAMSDEELANLLASKMANIKELEMAEKGIRVTATQISLLASRLHDIWLQWLRQPAENPVEWSKSGPCPVTPEQFDAIYNDEEETT